MKLAEQYTSWMEYETAYALDKFPVASQYPYFEQGVARGEFSFKISALNYLYRAGQSEAAAPLGDRRIGLRVTQALGKAAHNLVALQATAQSYWAGGAQGSHGVRKPKGIYIATCMDVFNATGDYLPEPQPGAMHVNRITLAAFGRQKMFEALQAAQDRNDRLTFTEFLNDEIRSASLDFMAAAAQYGWPAPGVSSGTIAEWQPE